MYMKKYYADIKTYTNMIYQKYEHIVISGDLNEHSNNPKARMAWLLKMGMITIFEEQYPEGIPQTHERVSAAIDHIWVSRKLHMQIIATCMYFFGAGPDYDHRPIHIDIRMTCNKRKTRKYNSELTIQRYNENWETFTQCIAQSHCYEDNCQAVSTKQLKLYSKSLWKIFWCFREHQLAWIRCHIHIRV